MHLQDLLAADNVRVRNDHLAVEAAGTQQRRVENVWAVGCGDQDDRLVGFKAVHLDQKLVERLLALIIAAAKAGTAMAADGVDLVDEDDARAVLLGLLEHVAHAAGADADEHLDEVRTRNGEEGHIGFAGDRARQQRLAGSGRANQEHAARDLAAQALELLRVAQELDDLLQVLLGFIHAGDIVEGHAAVRLSQEFCLGLAEAHCARSAALHLAHEEDPDAQNDDHGQPGQEHRHERIGAVAFRPCANFNAAILEPCDKLGVAGREGLEGGARVAIGADNLLALDGHRFNAAIGDILQELGVGHVARGGRVAWRLEHVEQGDQHQRDDRPQGKIAVIGVHQVLPLGAGRRRVP